MPKSRLDSVVNWFVELRPRTADRVAAAVIIGGVVAHILFILTTPLTLAPDEAHYWDWSRKLDFAYYSKGPMVALVIRAGTVIFGDTALGVRIGAVVFQAATLTVFYCMARSWCLPGVALLLLLALRSTLMFTSIGLVATTDPATAFLWLSALCAALRGLKQPRWWVLVGVCIGAAFLAKYTSAILGLSFGLFLLAYRRDLFRSPWLYVGALFAFLGVLPILLWNSANDWVNFAHNAGHVGAGKAVAFKLTGLLDLLGSQIGLYGVVLAPLLFVGGVTAFRRVGNLNEQARLILFTAFPVVVLCLSVALFRRVYANWPMPAFLSLFLLLAQQLRVFRATVLKLVVVGTFLNALILVPAYAVFYGGTFGLNAHYLPTKKLVGWDEVGKHAESLVQNSRLFPRKAFVLSENYDALSAVLFAMGSHPEGLCAVVDERRMNQYDLWGRWEEAHGENILLVLKDPASAAKLAPDFASIESLPPHDGLAVRLGTTEVRRIYFFRGVDYSGRRPDLPHKR